MKRATIIIYAGIEKRNIQSCERSVVQPVSAQLGLWCANPGRGAAIQCLRDGRQDYLEKWQDSVFFHARASVFIVPGGLWQLVCAVHQPDHRSRQLSVHGMAGGPLEGHVLLNVFASISNHNHAELLPALFQDRLLHSNVGGIYHSYPQRVNFQGRAGGSDPGPAGSADPDSQVDDSGLQPVQATALFLIRLQDHTIHTSPFNRVRPLLLSRPHPPLLRALPHHQRHSGHPLPSPPHVLLQALPPDHPQLLDRHCQWPGLVDGLCRGHLLCQPWLACHVCGYDLILGARDYGILVGV